MESQQRGIYGEVWSPGFYKKLEHVVIKHAMEPKMFVVFARSGWGMVSKKLSYFNRLRRPTADAATPILFPHASIQVTRLVGLRSWIP